MNNYVKKDCEVGLNLNSLHKNTDKIDDFGENFDDKLKSLHALLAICSGESFHDYNLEIKGHYLSVCLRCIEQIIKDKNEASISMINSS